ncbi:AMP-binding protein [Nocardia nova]|nr:AMP-binding protein [Nocardia nova]
MASAAISFADRAAISDGECLHDYASLWEAVQFFAADLSDARIRPGARIAIYAGAGYEALPAILAVEQIGAVAVLLDNSDTPEVTRYKLADAGADYLICHFGDDHIAVEAVDEIDATGLTMTTIAGDYTLVRLRFRATRSRIRGSGFAFCSPDGSGWAEKSSAALMAAVLSMRDDLATTSNDVVAVTEPVTSLVLMTSILATLMSGACLSLRRYGGASPARVDEHLRGDEVSVLLCSDHRLTTLQSAGIRALQYVRLLKATQHHVVAVDQTTDSDDGTDLVRGCRSRIVPRNPPRVRDFRQPRCR